MAEYLGYTLVDDIHYEIWDRIRTRTKPHVLLLFHRHGIKSTIFNYVDNACRITKKPTITGCIFGASLPLASDMLGACANVIRCEKIQEICGDLKGDIWNANAIRVQGGIGAISDNTFTLEAAGVDKGGASKHYDFIKCDDVVNETNYESELDRERVLRRFRQLFNKLKTPGGEMWVLGTRYCPGDLYGYIIENMADLFEIIVIPDARMKDGVMQPVLPKVFPTMESLEAKRKELGDYLYNCNFKQDPKILGVRSLYYDNISVISDPELESIFKDIKAGRIEQQKLRLILDPASEIERGSNSSGLGLVYYDGRFLNILRLWKVKMILDDLCDLAADVIAEFGLKYFLCEKSGLESNVQFVLNQKLTERGLQNYVCIDPVSHGKIAKTSRIIALQPFIDNKKVRRARSFEYQQKGAPAPVEMFERLREEMNGFPYEEKDDLLDTLAYSLVEEGFDLAYAGFDPSPIRPPQGTPSAEAMLEDQRRVKPDDDSINQRERVEWL